MSPHIDCVIARADASRAVSEAQDDQQMVYHALRVTPTTTRAMSPMGIRDAHRWATPPVSAFSISISISFSFRAR
jgi:hypothetical protein